LELYPQRIVRLELTHYAWKAQNLPLIYTRKKISNKKYSKL